MQKLLNYFEQNIAPVFMKIASNHVMQAISKGFIIASPLTIAGAFFQLFVSLPLGGWYTNFLQTSGLGAILNLPLAVTSNILALLLCFTIAYSYTQIKGKNNLAVTAAIIAVCAFLIVIPFSTEVVQDGVTVAVNNVIPTQWLGSQGIFVAIIVSLLSTVIYIFAIDKKWTLKMPDGVPSNVATSFESLIPGILILITFIAIRVGLSLTSFKTLHILVLTVLQIPLQSLTNNVWTFLLCMFLMQLLWLVGVHGPTIIFSVMAPMWTANATENLAAVTAGTPAPNVISTAFYVMLNSFGGSGMTLALVFMMTFLAKSKQLKTLGKLSIAPAIFNINEPIIFGIPIVMNPVLAIPFTITPVVISALAYMLTKINFLSVVSVSGPTQIPIIMKAIMFGGDKILPWILFHIVAFVITWVIWYPFFKMLDKQTFQNETN